MKRALITVSDKSGLVDFARGIVALGFEIVSTGGTATALSEASIPVVNVSEVTKFPEMLDGRLKILHPAIQAPLLAENTQEHNAVLTAYNWSRFDVVVCNPYAFKDVIAKPGCTYEKANENIDIGGPGALRAACKGGDRYVVVHPSDYGMVLQALQNPLSVRNLLAEEIALLPNSAKAFRDIQQMTDPETICAKVRHLLKLRVFRYTSQYDTAIANYEEHELLK